MSDPAASSAAGAFTAAGLAARARDRLSLTTPPDPVALGTAPLAGDHRLDGLPPRTVPPRAASVLIGAMERPAGATLLMTLRAAHLRDHSAQIAFPGGKIDPSDASPAAAAIREAEEEVGLPAAAITPLGYLDPYLTGTGFLIVPTVALIALPVALRLNPDEVDEAFEVPLAFLMDQANHGRGTREFDGRLRSFYVMAYGERRIWGVTAGVIRTLYDRLYA